MAMDLDEYRNLDIKEIGAWPLPAKLAVFLIIFVLIQTAAYFTFWQDQITQNTEATNKEQTLKDEYLDKKRRAVNLDAYKQQLVEIRQSLSELLKQLPKKSEMDALLTDINQAGVGRGLSFALFKPASQEIKTAEMAELPIQVQVSGSYHDFAQFASDIAQLPRIVNLKDIDISTSSKDGGMVMSATAKTFRYLDQQEIDEMSAQKQPEPGK
ncbi:type 4a pilus biogenesis protein PilO [Leeia sp. TBRC 13508]|uniref:Type 4a pilus biogenesis protein PilO n=1 Tax=Leeia speluncae TaxID=2884804 RepID=A0ABS8D2X0_9NEIS|nr:type 4a pilus biogenesis protein PilO [Leeia speluncae]MCB6182551.1 type 4a pilus biogenesis protein PilO [Leeia speluncae]